MKAIGLHKALPISDAQSLLDLNLPDPVAQGHDLLVEIKAVSVNPVDTKVRASAAPAAGEAKVLGYDASGIVRAVGSDVSLFKPGDRVWYAGSLTRPGTNSELHLVDERIVGHMPKTLDFAHAAAMPLTTITAWELLFDRFQVPQGDAAEGQSLLIVGAAGGVGSVMVQLARQLTGLSVIGTASRQESRDWVSALGAHHVIDHSKPLAEELKRAGLPQVTYIASLNQTDAHFDQLVEALVPQGKFGLIDDPAQLDVRKLKRKSASLHWEFMFTRSMFTTPDIAQQNALLNRVAELVDQGTIKTTLAEHFGAINATNLKRAHALLESQRSVGKIVLEGF